MFYMNAKAELFQNASLGFDYLIADLVVVLVDCKRSYHSLIHLN